MRDRFISITSQLLDKNPRLALVLAEISRDGFDRAQRAHPDRVINVGIREQLLIGAGAGLALTGMRPIEQVKLDFGHQGVGGVLVGAGGSCDWPASGFTHMSPGDVALLV